VEREAGQQQRRSAKAICFGFSAESGLPPRGRSLSPKNPKQISFNEESILHGGFVMAAAKKTKRKATKRKAVKRKATKRKAVKRTSTPRRWSARVTQTSDAMDLQADVFKRSPAEIARSVKRSAEKSKRRKSTPYRSAMSMLVFYENRAGKNLSARQRSNLEKAKDELRKLFDR
jgi:hypothetical protein